MAALPPGYRFYPTEEELVRFYLRHKLDGSRRADIERVIPVADVCSLDPWQLPEVHRGACASHGEPWFYFCARQDREARGGRPSRTTPSGYWKAAGTPGLVYSAGGHLVGTKKTMVFYRGRAPAGAKTKWKMNEYRALEEDGADADAAAPASNPVFQVRSEFSLCRLYTSSGNMRQFDRRPCTAVAGGSRASSSAALASPNEDVEVGRGQKRKRHAANDNTSSSDAYRHVQQQQGKQEGANEELADDMTDWAEVLAWI
ncbi:hypothetical protein CFC21_002865 [Triticum aestivum]|uniref:NAC domain-containing protein n=2 Tax=Triticum TaxID=4564 RepID=A0A9R0UYR2_TRITD|nr:NAC domain-containing protein 90-like [Triticum aestivum]KAF6984921.1 hypothetical protein CFC21_002865 [Triticum aestivum]VAH07854.1 unnamed protein product [Triticum turgidum subsp. durum]